MNLKRSPWIFDQHPTIPGVYERFVAGTYARWTGARWCSSRGSIEAAAESDDRSSAQGVHCAWRDLAEAPK
jgi:hypothetical protein